MLDSQNEGQLLSLDKNPVEAQASHLAQEKIGLNQHSSLISAKEFTADRTYSLVVCDGTIKL